MFVHHVYFWLKNPGNDTERQQLLEGIRSLLTIEPKISAHVGVPAGTNRGVIDSSYSFSLLLMFDNGADEQHYQQHPTHLKFVADCQHLWERVVVYDAIDA